MHQPPRFEREERRRAALEEPPDTLRKVACSWLSELFLCRSSFVQGDTHVQSPERYREVVQR